MVGFPPRSEGAHSYTRRDPRLNLPVWIAMRAPRHVPNSLRTRDSEIVRRLLGVRPATSASSPEREINANRLRRVRAALALTPRRPSPIVHNMVNHQSRHLDRVFLALGDPTRRAILTRLARDHAVSTSALAEPFEIK